MSEEHFDPPDEEEIAARERKDREEDPEPGQERPAAADAAAAADAPAPDTLSPSGAPDDPAETPRKIQGGL
jgi:hypothetical protein